MLPSLIKKAVGDAGFDLLLGADAEWEKIGVSGFADVAWVLPVGGGALLAVSRRAVLAEFLPTTWTEVPLPSGAEGAIRCQTPAELYHVLRRTRVLLAQLPPAPEKRFAARLVAIDSTETYAILMQRVGQDLFRDMLMEYWEGKCAVTGLDVPALLRASHAKPWKDSNGRERLDIYNGFLLAVHLDALFDQGLMTFDMNGEAVFSTLLTEEARKLLCPQDTPRLARLAQGHRPYLEYHSAFVFRTEAD